MQSPGLPFSSSQAQMSLYSGLYMWLSSLGKPALEFFAPLLSEILSLLSRQPPPFHHLIACEVSPVLLCSLVKGFMCMSGLSACVNVHHLCAVPIEATR